MTSSGDATYQELLDSAHALADRSGRCILPYFRQPMVIDNKASTGFDPVTAADRAAEQSIREELALRHPDHAILGEEFGATTGASPYTWVIDPIDGTKAFITGMPLWGTLIGLTHEGRAIMGLMDQPFTRERIWAGPDATFWRQNDGGPARRVSTRPRVGIEDACLTTTGPQFFAPDELAAFDRVKARARFVRYGGDCYAYCLLAAGHIDIVVEAGLKPYDIVALIPIIERAGGCITTWDGGRPENGGRIVAVGDPALHATVLELLAG